MTLLARWQRARAPVHTHNALALHAPARRPANIERDGGRARPKQCFRDRCAARAQRGRELLRVGVWLRCCCSTTRHRIAISRAKESVQLASLAESQQPLAAMAPKTAEGPKTMARRALAQHILTLYVHKGVCDTCTASSTSLMCGEGSILLRSAN